jgi:hypothetical protein
MTQEGRRPRQSGVQRPVLTGIVAVRPLPMSPLTCPDVRA